MIFRLTIHAAALSWTAAAAEAEAARSSTTKHEGERITEEDHREESPSIVTTRTDFGVVNDDYGQRTKAAVAAYFGAFVPSKLKVVVDDSEFSTENDNSTTRRHEERVVPRIHRHNAFEEKTQNIIPTNATVLRNGNSHPSFGDERMDERNEDKTTARRDKGDDSTAQLAAFDTSRELGILGNDNEDARKLVTDDGCDGKHPLVDPVVNFQAVITRCLYYKDNCPYNTTLPMGCWDTSQVEDMSYAFYKHKYFNEPIESWNTAAVTDMSDMFGFTASFNQPLSSWDLRSVSDTSDMFWGAQSFNQPVGSWNTSAVQNMDYMFLDARSFNHSLDEWDVSNVIDMKYMFAFAESFNQPLNSWQTVSVTDMNTMFGRAIVFDQPLNNWQTGAVTNMKSMFLGAQAFNQNVDAWETNAVTDMTYMFNNALLFNQCLSTWAYKNPTTITGPAMFNGTECRARGIPNAVAGPWCQTEYDLCYASTVYTPTIPPSAGHAGPFSSAGRLVSASAASFGISWFFW